MDMDCLKRLMAHKPGGELGRVGYLVLWLLGAPVTLLLVLWVIFGNNLIGRG